MKKKPKLYVESDNTNLMIILAKASLLLGDSGKAEKMRIEALNAPCLGAALKVINMYVEIVSDMFADNLDGEVD